MHSDASPKIIIADRQHLVRIGVKSYLLSEIINVEIFEASNCLEAAECLSQHLDVDLMIVDASLADGCDPGFIRAFRSDFPNIGIILLTECRDPESLIFAYDLGVRGFVPKSCAGDILLWAVRLVLGGAVYIPPDVLNLLRVMPHASGENKCLDEVPAKPYSKKALAVLTERQREILDLVARGFSNKEICKALGLSTGTVKNYVAAILRGLGVKNRTEAVSIRLNNEGAHVETQARARVS